MASEPQAPSIQSFPPQPHLEDSRLILTVMRMPLSSDNMGEFIFPKHISKTANVRIFYRSRQKGFLELDLLLGEWAEDNIQDLHGEQLEVLVEVLDVENPDLWKWLTGQDGAPESLTSNMVQRQDPKSTTLQSPDGS
ncbi:hypothetical protein O6H91_13G088800 [Diphasiastrum complanatum]|uniref:Uncharacterized protein n=1 Tax=Diphasiastrum complanatum TaxID=34168 RepID=A0ACC2BY34_DIPCM|nr:hypothetical protein O6H91_13G088800 [Diphasiastrum complanatum]